MQIFEIRRRLLAALEKLFVVKTIYRFQRNFFKFRLYVSLLLYQAYWKRAMQSVGIHPMYS